MREKKSGLAISHMEMSPISLKAKLQQFFKLAVAGNIAAPESSSSTFSSLQENVGQSDTTTVYLLNKNKRYIKGFSRYKKQIIFFILPEKVNNLGSFSTKK